MVNIIFAIPLIRPPCSVSDRVHLFPLQQKVCVIANSQTYYNFTMFDGCQVGLFQMLLFLLPKQINVSNVSTSSKNLKIQLLG